MRRSPGVSLALFTLVVLIVLSLASIGHVQESPPESEEPPEAQTVAQQFMADIIPAAFVVVAGAFTYRLARVAG
jgi:hypothetical protein